MLESQPHVLAMKCKNYKKTEQKKLYFVLFNSLNLCILIIKAKKYLKIYIFVRYNRGSVRYNQEEI
jgi:hypothetical protein